MPDRQWYTNRDLFELINELQGELRETKLIIKRYNGLYEKVGSVEKRMSTIEVEQRTKLKSQDRFIKWSGYIFGLVSVIVTIITLYYNLG